MALAQCGATPYSCANGYFTVERADGGVCDFSGNTSTLGVCANLNILIANHGYACSGCDWIRLYWGASYTGAYFCVAPGQFYAQSASPDSGFTFDHGSTLSGYGSTIWNNAHSAKWSGAC